jgi:hypothetical protein
MRRFTWFLGGIAAGAAGAEYTRRKVRSKAAELAPAQVVRRAAGGVRSLGDRVGEALREGRVAKRSREAELRARLEGRASTLADELGADARLQVDGRPVEPGRVIVLRDVRRERPERRRSR